MILVVNDIHKARRERIMLSEEIKQQIESCKTKKQVMEILKRNNIKIIRDNSDEVGCFSVWIDELTRIYKPMHRNMKVQTWRTVSMSYSGVPVFFG